MASNPKGYFKKRFNISKWIGADHLIENASLLKNIVSPTKTPEEISEKNKTKNMSFEEIIQLNQWSGSDIENNKKHQKRMSFGFIAFSCVLLAIAIYLFITNNFFGGLFSLAFMLLSLAYAYQSWVSFEQLKQHKIRINVKASFLSLFKK